MTVGEMDGDVVAILLKGYPRLSETFIAQEIRALERRGFNVLIYSMRFPTDKDKHPIHKEIEASVVYLPEYLRHEPKRVFRAWRKLRRTPLYATARRIWLRDLWRDRTPNRVRRFGQALVLAAELPSEVRHIYAHFLHTPASVARYAAIMSLRPWSVSAHAKDIWTSPDWEKQEKLADCEWAVTCTAVGARHLSEMAKEGGAPADKVSLVYHGLDLARFPQARPRPMNDGGDPRRPVTLLTVCRAVEKKGLDDLIAAVAQLPKNTSWRLIHIGGGPMLDQLKAQATAAGVGQRIDWFGPRAQAEVIQAYREADLFVLPSKIADDGDRDGLPNVLMEAATQALPMLATNVSAIPEFIDDGATGVLIPPGEPDALAAALTELIAKPQWRTQLGAAAEARVRSAFDFAEGVDRVAGLLGEPDRRQDAA